MGALEKFIEEQTNKIDLAGFLSPEVFEMETQFSGNHIFKYFPESRVAFFTQPQIRFTQKSALNDPFELTKRWHEFTSSSTRNLFKKHLKDHIAAFYGRSDIILEGVSDEFKRRGQILSIDQRASADMLIRSSFGQAFLTNQFNSISALIDPLIDNIFLTRKDEMENTIERHLSKIGVFSLSEIPNNKQLWALYASEGKGFVVDFNPNHSFFRVRRPYGANDCALRVVKYTNDLISEFWKNPYYLFCVKDADWSFEKEWRMIKELSHCDEKIDVGSDNIYLWNVSPGMINEIIFGYKYDASRIPFDVLRIRNFDPTIKVKVATVHLSVNDIVISDLTY